jgi:hypothetical protein
VRYMHRRRISAIPIAIMIVASVQSFAGTFPPETPFDSMTWNATLKKKPATGINMGALRVQLERTTLDEVRRAASTGEIAHQGDAGESTYWLCYTKLSPTPVERIWIIAHGEMGGPEHVITNISAQLLPNGIAEPDCPALPSNLRPMSLDHHLWLRSPAIDVRKRLGAPSYQQGPWRSYDYQGKEPGNCEGEGFDLMNRLLLRSEKGHVTSLQVGQVTSC